MGITSLEAIRKLRKLIGRDLHEIAKEHNVPVVGPSGKVNKGWAGHAIERYLGLQINSSRAPNLGSWELKVIPLKRNSQGELVFKETMAVTMIDGPHIVRQPFSQSHLLCKLQRMVVVARTVGKDAHKPSIIHAVGEFRLDGPLYKAVKADYDKIRKLVTKEGIDALSGKMGAYIQPRTKGPGHGSRSRAFYARIKMLNLVVDI